MFTPPGGVGRRFLPLHRLFTSPQALLESFFFIVFFWFILEDFFFISSSSSDVIPFLGILLDHFEGLCFHLDLCAPRPRYPSRVFCLVGNFSIHGPPIRSQGHQLGLPSTKYQVSGRTVVPVVPYLGILAFFLPLPRLFSYIVVFFFSFFCNEYKHLIAFVRLRSFYFHQFFQLMHVLVSRDFQQCFVHCAENPFVLGIRINKSF